MQRIVAALLAAVLLSMPCAASTCEIVCASATAASGGHAHRAAFLQGAGVGSCGMSARAGRAGIGSGVQAGIQAGDRGSGVDACHHPVCKLQPPSVDAEQLRSVLKAIAVQQPLVTLVPVYPPAAAVAHAGLFAPPPLRSSLLIRLQTKLRV